MAVIRQMGTDDLSAVAGILESAYEGRRVDGAACARHMQWASVKSAAVIGENGLPIGLLAENDAGEPLGYCTFSYRLLKNRGILQKAAVQNSLAVRSEAQGMLGIRLCRETVRYFREHHPDFPVLGLHHSEAAGKVWAAIGSRGIEGSQENLAAVCSPARLLGQRPGITGKLSVFAGFWPISAILGKILEGRGLRMTGRIVLPDGVHMDCSQDSLPGMIDDEFLADCTDKMDFGVVRNRAYLDWRYQQHPSQSYCFVSVFNNRSRGPVGLIVLYRDKQETVFLEDVLFRDSCGVDSGDRVEIALAAAVKYSGAAIRSKIIDGRFRDAWLERGLGNQSKPYPQFFLNHADDLQRGLTYSYGDASEGHNGYFN